MLMMSIKSAYKYHDNYIKYSKNETNYIGGFHPFTGHEAPWGE